MLKRYTLKLIAVILLFLSFTTQSAWSGEIQYAKVVEIGGAAELLKPLGQRWVPLMKDTTLKKGAKIRTGSGSFVQIAFEGNLETVGLLEGDSRLDIMNDPPTRVFLDRGEFLIFRETETSNKSGLKKLGVLTREALVEIQLGGCSVQTFDKGTWVRVFGEKAEVMNLKTRSAAARSKTVEEGFKLFIGRIVPESVLQRMGFADYAEWQGWIKKLYEAKDDLAADALDKELAI